MSTLNLKEIKNPNAASGIQLLNDGGVVLPGSLTSTVTGGGGSISGDRNRVINGSCQIVNVATFVAANNTNGYGGPEMFQAVNSGAGGQFTQSQGSLTFEGITLPTVRQTVNTAITSTATTNFWHGIITAIEGYNAFDLRGKPVVVSFVFNTNVTGTYSVALRDSTPAQSYVTTITATANTPVQVKIPIAAIPLAASVPNTNAQGLSIAVGFLNTGTLQTPTLNAWQSGNFVSATGATNWGATAGNFIELTRLQLEEGTVATPFVWRSYGQELLLTKRYFQWISSIDGEEDLVAIATASNSVSFAIKYEVEMRTAPTISGVVRINPNDLNGILAQLSNGLALVRGSTQYADLRFTKATANLTAGTAYQVDVAIAGGATRLSASARL
jgi:hypothetical protein